MNSEEHRVLFLASLYVNNTGERGSNSSDFSNFLVLTTEGRKILCGVDLLALVKFFFLFGMLKR